MKPSAVFAVGLLASLAVVPTGCLGPIYHHGLRPEASAVSSHVTWIVSGDLDHPQYTIDDDVNTAALSGPSYTNAALTIDLGKPCLFNMVVIDHGERRDGFCRRTAVLTSMDGRNFTYVYAAPGTRRVTVLNWVTPVLARYVRLQAVQMGAEPWSVAEVYVQ